VQQRLFEAFFTTKSHGLGMGLTIARTIIERHNGILRAENGSDGGARFTIILPALSM
jgi:signal transduction histidine kinase